MFAGRIGPSREPHAASVFETAGLRCNYMRNNATNGGGRLMRYYRSLDIILDDQI